MRHLLVFLLVVAVGCSDAAEPTPLSNAQNNSADATTAPNVVNGESNRDPLVNGDPMQCAEVSSSWTPPAGVEPAAIDPVGIAFGLGAPLAAWQWTADDDTSTVVVTGLRGDCTWKEHVRLEITDSRPDVAIRTVEDLVILHVAYDDASGEPVSDYLAATGRDLEFEAVELGLDSVEHLTYGPTQGLVAVGSFEDVTHAVRSNDGMTWDAPTPMVKSQETIDREGSDFAEFRPTDLHRLGAGWIGLSSEGLYRSDDLTTWEGVFPPSPFAAGPVDFWLAMAVHDGSLYLRASQGERDDLERRVFRTADLEDWESVDPPEFGHLFDFVPTADGLFIHLRYSPAFGAEVVESKLYRLVGSTWELAWEAERFANAAQRGSDVVIQSGLSVETVPLFP